MSNSNYKEFGSLLTLAIVMFGVIGLVILLLRLDNILSPLELLLILFVPTVVFLILASIILRRKKWSFFSKYSLSFLFSMCFLSRNGLGGIRTLDRSVKSRLLHLAELQAQKQERWLNYVMCIKFFLLTL